MSLNERRGREASGPATDAAALLLRLGVVALAILIPCASVISRRPLFILTPIGMVLVILGSRLWHPGVHAIGHRPLAFRQGWHGVA